MLNINDALSKLVPLICDYIMGFPSLCKVLLGLGDDLQEPACFVVRVSPPFSVILRQTFYAQLKLLKLGFVRTLEAADLSLGTSQLRLKCLYFEYTLFEADMGVSRATRNK